MFLHGRRTSGQIDDFEEEVFIIRIPIAVAADGINFPICTFYLATRDMKRSVGDDTIVMILQKFPEPDNVLVSRIKAEPDQGIDNPAHMHRQLAFIGLLEFLLDYIAGKEQFILVKKLMIAVYLAALLNNLPQIEQIVGWPDHMAFGGTPIFLFQGING